MADEDDLRGQWQDAINDKLQQADEDELKRKWESLPNPHFLRQYNPENYTPKLVSLGPYHLETTELRQTDRHKWRALRFMLLRNDHQISQYLDAVRELEGPARDCYEGETTLTSNQFVEMMVLDGCFLIEFLLGLNEGFQTLGYPADDSFFNVEILREGILIDIIKLENQIPFFVLNKLLSIQRPTQHESYLIKLSIKPFHLRISSSKFDLSVRYKEGLHNLDILRRNLLLDAPDPTPSGLEHQAIGSGQSSFIKKP